MQVLGFCVLLQFSILSSGIFFTDAKASSTPPSTGFLYPCQRHNLSTCVATYLRALQERARPGWVPVPGLRIPGDIWLSKTYWSTFASVKKISDDKKQN